MSWGSFKGYGVEWKCKKCGKYTNLLSHDGLGPCCDEELKHQVLREKAREVKRRDLIFALQSRVLTDAEMEQVQSWDYHLLVRDGVPFFEHDVRRQFSDLLLAQFKIRQAAKTALDKSEKV